MVDNIMSDIVWTDTSNLDPEGGYDEQRACIDGYYYIVRTDDYASDAILLFSYLEFYSDDSTIIKYMKSGFSALKDYAVEHAKLMKTRKNVIHELDPIDVAYEINRSIDAFDKFVNSKNKEYVEFYERKPLIELNVFGEPFASPEEKANEYDNWMTKHNKSQTHHYANVRIVERACIIDSDSKYILVYDDNIDDNFAVSGTGGFGSVDAAKRWFLDGGR